MERKHRYLTYIDRLIIERMYNAGTNARSIARFLSVSPSTISRELRRGFYDRLDGRTWKMYRAYSADIAQQDADYKNTAKGRPLKIGNNHALAQHIESEILAGKSPDIIIAELSMHGKRPFSTVTLYRYIDKGLFLRISNANLLEKSRRKRDYNHVKKAARPPVGTSIEYRPSHIDNRFEFGHWEMDCVIGKAEGKHQALLTFVERKTRFTLIFPLGDKSAHSVVRVLNRLSSSMDFPRVFKSITVDNGSEFSDCRGMEFAKDGTRRTTVYYCHPYTSCERGSNERMNRMIRRFFPKGHSLAKVTRAQCQAAADWLNAYPRRNLAYASPADLFNAELANLP